jgi:hypothetical protein
MADVDFVVRGFVDGRPATAHFERGVLEADPELVRRAEIIVALGEEFVVGKRPKVHASLDGGVATALTVMRAFSVVTSVHLEMSPKPA